jgi:hypothetical protein
MAPIDTHPYRLEMNTFAKIHGLKAQKGFDTSLHGPLAKPGRAFLLRIQKQMIALFKTDKKKWAAYAKVKPTSTLDAPTRAALLPPITFGEQVAHKLLSQVGVHEVPWGSNSGAQVRVYESPTGGYGEPWCASFRSWGLQQCGYTGTVSARAWAFDDIGVRISNGTDHIANAQVGDAVTFNIGDGHIGTYLSHTATSVKTVDGNTSDEVAVRERPLSVIRFITRQGK